MTIAASSDAPVVVSVEGLSKRFVLRKDNSIKERVVTLGRVGHRHREDFWALRDVDIEVRAGTTIGLIGHNGSGKSTLLKVLGGIIEPTSGVVRQRGRVAALLELGAGFHQDLTGRENVYLNASILGMSRVETDKKFDSIVAFAGIGDFIDTQVKFYSSGMYVRLAFAVAVHTDPDLFLVDEVLSVGDEAFQRKCLERIREFQDEGRTIVLVTHSMSQVLDFCDRAVLLDHGRVVIDGTPKVAVHRLRELLEEARIAAMPEEDRHARADYRLERVAVSVEGEVLRPGGTLEFEVTVTSARKLDSWGLSLQVDSASGHAVYRTSTNRLSIPLPPFEGTKRMTIRLENAHFGGGRYFVNLSLLGEHEEHLFDLPAAASFVSEEQSGAAGVVLARPVFSGYGA